MGSGDCRLFVCQFSGIAALELLKSTGLDIPFVIVSGSIGEDFAVDVMKSGATIT